MGAEEPKLSRWRRAGFVTLAILAWLGMTYNPGMRWSGWWLSGIGTLCILACARAAWPGAWATRVGLRMSRVELLRSVGLLAAVTTIASVIVTAIARAKTITFDPWITTPHEVPWYLHTVAQTLNEEMLLGAVLLGGIRRRLPRTSPLRISIGVAAAFALFHLAFYGARTPEMPNYGVLSAATLLALFLVGIVRNNLILATGHVGYAEAVHLGWNAIFLGGAFRWAGEGGAAMTEPERFDAFVGSPAVIVLGAVGAVATAWLLRRNGDAASRLTPGGR